MIETIPDAGKGQCIIIIMAKTEEDNEEELGAV